MYVERGSVITRPDPAPLNSGLMAKHLKGLGHEINFTNMDGNGQIRASIRDAAGQRTAWASDLMHLQSLSFLVTLERHNKIGRKRVLCVHNCLHKN